MGGSAGDFERFLVKVGLLRAHEDHISLRKLRHNQQLTVSDLVELETEVKLLFEPPFTAYAPQSQTACYRLHKWTSFTRFWIRSVRLPWPRQGG